jgi:hypothetical protein
MWIDEWHHVTLHSFIFLFLSFCFPASVLGSATMADQQKWRAAAQAQECLIQASRGYILLVSTGKVARIDGENLVEQCEITARVPRTQLLRVFSRVITDCCCVHYIFSS